MSVPRAQHEQTGGEANEQGRTAAGCRPTTKSANVPPMHLFEPNGLGIAPSLNVEHALFAPGVLVVADERALGVSGQRSLAGACTPEEGRWDMIAKALRFSLG